MAAPNLSFILFLLSLSSLLLPLGARPLPLPLVQPRPLMLRAAAEVDAGVAPGIAKTLVAPSISTPTPSGVVGNVATSVDANATTSDALANSALLDEFGGPFTGGDLTFYTPTGTGGIGACGFPIANEDFLVAVAHEFFDNFPGATLNPNENPICGKMINATLNDKTVQVKVADRCGDCDIKNSIDVTPPAFAQLADLSLGRIHNVSWTFA